VHTIPYQTGALNVGECIADRRVITLLSEPCGTFILSRLFPLRQGHPLRSIRIFSIFLFLPAITPDFLFATNLVLDSRIVSRILRLFAFKDVPVSVIRRLHQRGEVVFTSVAPHEKSTSALIPLDLRYLFVIQQASVAMRLPFQILQSFYPRVVGNGYNPLERVAGLPLHK